VHVVGSLMAMARLKDRLHCRAELLSIWSSNGHAILVAAKLVIAWLMSDWQANETQQPAGNLVTERIVVWLFVFSNVHILTTRSLQSRNSAKVTDYFV